MTTLGYYWRLATREACPPELQRVLYGLAQATGDRPLRAALAANPNLADDIDTALGASEDTADVEAWLTRPGRTIDEILRRVEVTRSARTLAVLGARTDLPEDAYRGISAKAKTQAASWALLVNPACPRDLRLAAAKTFGQRTSSLKGNWPAKLELFLFAEADLVHAVAGASRSAEVLGALAHHPAIGADGARKVFELAVRDTFEDRWEGIAASSRMAWADQVFVRDLRRTLRRLHGNPATDAPLRSEVGSWLTSVCGDPTRKAAYVLSSHRTSGGDLVTPEAWSTAPSPTGLPQLPAGIGDAEALPAEAKRWSQSVQPPWVVRSAMRTIAGRVDCPLEALRLATAHLDAWESGPLLWERHLDRPEALAVLGGRLRDLLNDERLGRCADPAGVLAAAAVEAERTGIPLSITSRYLTAESIRCLPIRALLSEMSPEMETLFGSYLLSEFGDNIDRWALLPSVVHGRVATVGDAVEAVKAATA